MNKMNDKKKEQAKSTGKKYPAPAIAIGFNLVELIVQHSGLKFSVLQELTGINSESLNRYLITLQEIGYIEKYNNTYIPSAKLTVLNSTINIYDIIKRRARPYLEKLEEEFEMTVALFALSLKNIYCIDKVQCLSNVCMAIEGDNPEQNRVCSWGVLTLIHMSEEEIHEYMEKNCRETYRRIDQNKFYKAVQYAKKHQYCDNNYSSTSHVRSIAFPIYDSYGNMVASLAVGSFRLLLDDQKAEHVIQRLKQYTEEISLGGSKT